MDAEEGAVANIPNKQDFPVECWHMAKCLFGLRIPFRGARCPRCQCVRPRLDQRCPHGDQHTASRNQACH